MPPSAEATAHDHVEWPPTMPWNARPRSRGTGAHNPWNAQPEPVGDSEDAALLQKQGDAHEAAHLERLKVSGKSVVEIPRGDLARDAEATRVALTEGAEVVFQGGTSSIGCGNSPSGAIRSRSWPRRSISRSSAPSLSPRRARGTARRVAARRSTRC